MIKLVAIFLIISIGDSTIPDKVDKKDKMLSKEIKKLWDIEDPEFKEILIPDSCKVDLAEVNKVEKIMNKDSLLGFVYFGRVNSCCIGGCSAPTENTKEFEYFDYFIIYNTNLIIQSVRVYNYQATHGQEVCSRSWLKQFNGYTDEDKLDIDAISGATISVNSLKVDVEFVTEQINKNKSILEIN